MKNIKIVRAKYIVDTENRRHGKPVMSLATGEVFTSAKELAEVKHLKYANLTLQLRKGKESTDGNLYCYVADMPYYADAIQQRIYRQNKLEYDAAKLKLASLGRLFDNE